MRYLSSLMPKPKHNGENSLHHKRLVCGLEEGKPVKVFDSIPWMNPQASEAKSYQEFDGADALASDLIYNLSELSIL